jgi:hypothetical protein
LREGFSVRKGYSFIIIGVVIVIGVAVIIIVIDVCTYNILPQKASYAHTNTHTDAYTYNSSIS